MEKSDHRWMQVLMAGALQLFACFIIYKFDIPNPNIILFVILSAVLVQYGHAAGVVCGGIAFLYSAFFFSTGHDWISYTPINQSKLVVITLGIVANIWLIGQLKKANRKAIQDVIRLEEEKKASIENAVRERQMFDALCINYTAACCCDLMNDSMELIKQRQFSHSAQSRGKMEHMNSYSEWIQYCYDHVVIHEAAPDFMEVFDRENLMKRLQNEECFTYRHRTVPNKAGMEYFEVTVVRFYSDDHSFKVIIGYSPIDDIIREEQKRNETMRQALLAANKANEAKSTFLHNMSHDIRTPLNGIIGLIKINKEHSDDAILVQANQEKMEIAAEHLLSLINDVLQISKLESGTEETIYEAVNLSRVFHDLVAIIRGQAIDKGIHWEFTEDAPLEHPWVMTSPLHLRQIFLNIYGNSVKFTKRGGKVSTYRECLGEKNGTVCYRWTISDTGVGMSKEFLAHIFEPFAQEESGARSDYQGTGLGMAIVKNLVEKMGGTISVSSEKGKGSTFVVEMPFAIASTTNVPEEKENIPQASIAGLHLLLAEDNKLNAEIAEMLLADQGAQITWVKDGKQALKRFQENPPGTFDAILMDVMMPVMDGIAATRAIRQLSRPDGKTIPIIAMTANAFAEDAKKCLDAGMNVHLSKPLEIEKMVAAIGKLVARKSNV